MQRHLNSRARAPGPCRYFHVGELMRKFEGFNGRVDKLEHDDADSGYGGATIGVHFGAEPRRRTRREKPIELPPDSPSQKPSCSTISLPINPALASSGRKELQHGNAK